MRSPSSTVKGAELVSGLGAIALGAGLALLMPQLLQPYAFAILVTGLLVHGIGMTLKFRLESRVGPPLWSERALFRLCWASLAVLGGWLVLRFLAT